LAISTGDRARPRALLVDSVAGLRFVSVVSTRGDRNSMLQRDPADAWADSVATTSKWNVSPRITQPSAISAS